jgi:hypothetical protein
LPPLLAIPFLLALAACMDPTSGNVHDAHSHPEYDVNGGQTFLVTYSRSTGAFTSEIRLVEVQVAPATTH